MNVNKFYADAMRDILTTGARDINKRTGIECAMLPGLTFQTDLEKEGLPLLSLRKIGVKPFVAEQFWFLSGSDNIIPWLESKTKIWNAFAEPDGRVTSAYGYRWRVQCHDQLGIAIKKLRDDPSTRHGVVMSWDPLTDPVVKQKNVPCPVMFTLMVSGGRLHLHLVVRSNDMVLGFPTDCAGFALLQMIIAQDLGLKPGIYTHSISNAHIYADHYEAAATMAARYDLNKVQMLVSLFITLPGWVLRMAEDLDDATFDDVVECVASQYQPLEAIRGLKIAL